MLHFAVFVMMEHLPWLESCGVLDVKKEFQTHSTLCLLRHTVGSSSCSLF